MGIALAYLFLVAYVARTVFISIRLPGAVGVFLTGFAFRYFMQTDMLGARDELQELAFFLVLLTAGFEINLKDLNLHTLILAWVPVSFEMLGIACCAYSFLGFDMVQAF